MKSDHKLDLPRRLQIEFSRVVQEHTDAEGGEVSPGRDVGATSARPTSTRGRPLQLELACTPRRRPARRTSSPSTSTSTGERRTLEGTGNGPIAAFVDALGTIGYDVRVLDYAEHALSSGGDAIAAAYVECAVGGQVLWGVGLDAEHRHGVPQGGAVGREPRLTCMNAESSTPSEPLDLKE